uniref:Putative secreted protein n=1 Tax=Amblyomma cajennense TaxID=34607 RepID=A0A023FTR5_AMBCJ
MFLVFVVAAGVFLSMGLGGTQPTKGTEKCPDPATPLPSHNPKLILKGYAESCTCNLTDGKTGQHADGTQCFGVQDGRRGIGNCSSGVCNLAKSTFGCAGKNGTEKGSVIKDESCFFECTNENGGTEWAFLPDGSSCVNKDDGDHPKNGTCKHRPHRDRADQNETVCFPNDQLYLVGC